MIAILPTTINTANLTISIQVLDEMLTNVPLNEVATVVTMLRHELATARRAEVK